MLESEIQGPVWVCAVLARWWGNFWVTREEILAVCHANDELLQMDSEQLWRHCWNCVPEVRRDSLSNLSDVHLWLVVHPWAAACIEHAFVWRPLEVELEQWAEGREAFTDPAGLALVPAEFLDVWHRPQFVELPADCDVVVTLVGQASLVRAPHILGEAADIGNPLLQYRDAEATPYNPGKPRTAQSRDTWHFRVARQSYAPGIVPAGYILADYRECAADSCAQGHWQSNFKSCLLQEIPSQDSGDGRVASGAAAALSLDAFSASGWQELLHARRGMSKRHNMARRPLLHEQISAQLEFRRKLADDSLQ